MDEVWPTPRQSPGYSLKRRVRSAVLRLLGRQPHKSQDLRFVTINGHRFKRLILRDSYMATAIEENLGRFGPSDLFPPLVTCFENEVWVEFIDGPAIDRIDDGVVERMADFYHDVHARRPRQVAVDETAFVTRLRQDLRFLNQVAVLSDETYRALEDLAGRIAPSQVWIGFDYVDPVLKNFIVRPQDAGFCAIDVESLQDDQLIGTGVAKACVHWLEPYRAVFLERIAARGGPEFLPYFDFVELCLLARWTKTKFLTEKWKFVDPKRFDRFLGP